VGIVCDGIECLRLRRGSPLYDWIAASDSRGVRAGSVVWRRQSSGRSAAPLDPAKDAARAAGFTKVALMATLAGEPPYRARRYEPAKRILDDRGGAAVPLLRMSKRL
jgi:hypothetical protein